MQQILLDPGTGTLSLAEVPSPQLKADGILVRTAVSVISIGTERNVVEFAERSLVGKARARPEQLRQVLRKVQTDGVMPTLQAVRAKLGAPQALGYSSAGQVLAVGRRVTDLRVGDWVACAGAGYASHAEVAYVPRTLCSPIPEEVPLEEAAFATIGAIALQGIRLAAPALGERVVVVGLGLIGLIAVQLLRINGCHVFGVDLHENRVARALEIGAQAGGSPQIAERAVRHFTRDRGADAVIIAASTLSNEPVALAGRLCRSRGRVIAVGAVGMTIPRPEYYSKELSFAVSMSYGPGRYDPHYEDRGIDYPFAHVRWTAGRNLEAFLDAVANGGVRIAPLITHRFSFDAAPDAYEVVRQPDSAHALGVVLRYATDRELPRRVALPTSGRRAPARGSIRFGIIGGGSFAKAVLLPALAKQEGVSLEVIATARGLSAFQTARSFGIRTVASTPEDVIEDPDLDAVVIATRHDSHAALAIAALEAGKAVFLEKPLALTAEDVELVCQAAARTSAPLMLGFNRRFAPLTQAIRRFFAHRSSPMALMVRVNAGVVPADHWVQDPQLGGGRIVGEVCHHVDLFSHLSGSLPVQVFAQAARGLEDVAIIMLRFADDSVGSVAFLSNGDRAIQKEEMEVFADGAVAQLDDFRRLVTVRGGNRRQTKLRRADKGHRAEVEAFLYALRSGGPSPTCLQSVRATSLATIAAVESLRSSQPVNVR